MGRDAKKQYQCTVRYKAKSIKRVPLDVQKIYFDQILLPAAQEAGETVNGYIKKAINMRLGLTEEEVQERIAAYKEAEVAEESSPEEENP